MPAAVQASASDDVREFLTSSAAYPERPDQVRTIETHISWVFLTDGYAYKLKKPVKFDFVDFSTADLRHRACLDELRLNRRLAPDVYLDVLSVTAIDDGSLAIGTSGRVVDWLVQMRRLPADRALDRVLRECRLDHKDANAIADYLATFYTRLPHQSVGADNFCLAIDRHIRANQAALTRALPDDHARLRRIHGAQLRFVHLQRPLFDSRVKAGRIVDGHGDLRPEHIYVGRPPAVIDCLEFSEELRRADIADELSFLAMECERLGHRDVGELMLSRYEANAGDEIPHALCWFYRSYRACVRAKVSMLQVQQHSAEASQRSFRRLTHQYLEWADHYTPELGRPFLLVVYGLMGTGKSTLANRLGETFDIEVLSTDRQRRVMFGASPAPSNYGEGVYRSAERQLVYEALFRQAAVLLDRGQSVILDGAFLTRALRGRADDLSARHGAVPLEVLCECPREVALSRIQQRAQSGTSDSEARAELYDLQARELEPPMADQPQVRVDTSSEIPSPIQAIVDALRGELAGGQM